MSGKRLKTAKKALCLIFVLLLSINSFAAAVSDNDGSAFITKAEFDSLKNDFQSQIDSYNTSIDSVAAGYPFIYAKKDQKISIPIDFKQNANFDLWFKVGSFSNDEEVTDA